VCSFPRTGSDLAVQREGFEIHVRPFFRAKEGSGEFEAHRERVSRSLISENEQLERRTPVTKAPKFSSNTLFPFAFARVLCALFRRGRARVLDAAFPAISPFLSTVTATRRSEPAEPGVRYVVAMNSYRRRPQRKASAPGPCSKVPET